MAVFGGSLGARRLNEAVDGLVDAWKERVDRSVYHIVGRRDWDQWQADPGSEAGASGPTPVGGLAMVSVPFRSSMGLVYEAADVVVCRAGAMTVAELAVAGVPSMLVPLPGAPGDHQTANARVLERAGAVGAAARRRVRRGHPGRPGGPPARRPAQAWRPWAGPRPPLGRPDAAAAGARVVEAHARPTPAGAPVSGPAPGALRRRTTGTGPFGDPDRPRYRPRGGDRWRRA